MTTIIINESLLWNLHMWYVTRKVIFSLFATLQPVSLELKSSRKQISYQKLDNFFNNTGVKKFDLSRKATWNLSLSEKPPKNTHNGVQNSVCTHVNDLAKLSTDVMPEFQTLADNLSKLLLTITVYCCNHIPTTLGCHGNMFGYVEAQAFTFTSVSSKLLRMSRYSHLCTNIHKCAVFYSLGYRHCTLDLSCPELF